LPTEIEEMTKSLNDVLAHIRAIDLKGMGEAIARAALSVEQLTKTPELRTALKGLPRVVSGAGDLAESLHTDATKAGPAVDDARAAMVALRGTLENASGVISPHSPLATQVLRTLADIDKAATSVQQLADFLRRNPHAIVAGTKQHEEGK